MRFSELSKNLLFMNTLTKIYCYTLYMCIKDDMKKGSSSNITYLFSVEFRQFSPVEISYAGVREEDLLFYSINEHKISNFPGTS